MRVIIGACNVPEKFFEKINNNFPWKLLYGVPLYAIWENAWRGLIDLCNIRLMFIYLRTFELMSGICL